MAHFYRKLLEESEQKHEETVAATQSSSRTVKGPQGATPNLTIVRPPEFTPKSDAELARLAREQGKDVELNEDNQIVDKRELLSAGLNLSAPNTRRIGLHTTKKTDAPAAEVHHAVGSAASRKEINERRMREISSQLAEERERVVKEKERQESDATARLVARRNDDAGIRRALERYQERKRRKLEKSSEAAET
jgi:coiled-coil domain-containing protein 55